HCQRHLRQGACIVIMHIGNLLEYQRRPAPRRFTLNPRWPCLLQTVENLTADGKADMLPGVITHPFGTILQEAL
ncbi:hypothetical protein Q604_UNBC03194G0001, partial [human gut metagenome]